MSSRSCTLLFIAFWLLAGMYFALQGLALGIGNLSGPGTGMMPFASGVILIVLAVASAIPVIPSSAAETGERHQWGRLVPPLLGVIALVVYALVLERVGYIVSTFALVMFLSRILGNTSTLNAGVFGAVVAGVSYLIFSTLLGARLP